MAIAAQIEANRLNAQRSTGPKTERGKARARRNAITHGMTARIIMPVLPQEDPKELEALRRSVQRGCPFGQPEWQKEIAQRLGLESAYRPTGRPRKVGRNQDTSPG